MARIPPKLIELLKKRMAAAERTVYLTIQKTAAANRVSRDLGALLLAGEQEISYERFATPEQMAALRGAPAHVVAVEAPARRQSAKTAGRKFSVIEGKEHG